MSTFALDQHDVRTAYFVRCSYEDSRRLFLYFLSRAVYVNRTAGKYAGLGRGTTVVCTESSNLRVVSIYLLMIESAASVLDTTGAMHLHYEIRHVISRKPFKMHFRRRKPTEKRSGRRERRVGVLCSLVCYLLVRTYYPTLHG